MSKLYSVYDTPQEIGEKATNENAKEYPLELLGVYDPPEVHFYEVEEVDSETVKIVKELTYANMVDVSLEHTKEKSVQESYVTEDGFISGSTSDFGASSATSQCGASTATGDYGASSATGYYGASTATGDCGASTATGYYGSSESGNETAVAVAWGKRSKAKGVLGSYLVIADWRYDGKCKIGTYDCFSDTYHWHLHKPIAIQIDGKEYLPDTWYTVKDGKVVVAE